MNTSARRPTARRYLYTVLAMTLLPEQLWADECPDDTPLAQASHECILSGLQSTEKGVRAATMLPRAAESALQARTRALREAMVAAMPRAALLRLEAAGYEPSFVYTAAKVDLKAGDRRGRISYPLYRGTLGTKTKVYFVLMEASDQEFAHEFGITHASRLRDLSRAGVEEGTTLNSERGWLFAQDPGRVAHSDASGQVNSTVANPDYSPLKRLTWNQREVIVNIPFVKWGDGPGQTLIIDKGGCDPLIRQSPPDRVRASEGSEVGGEGCEQQDPLKRYRGGQVLDLQIRDDQCPGTPPWKPCGWVTMKLHQAVYREDIYPYITVFAASEASVAEELGVLHTPKLAQAGRSASSPPLAADNLPGRNAGVSSIVEFHNGVEAPDGGPEGFQPGAISYGDPTWSTYSPILHVTWAFFDCGGSGAQFLKYWNTACPEVVRKLARNPYGIVYRNKLLGLWDARTLLLTESPAGWMVDATGEAQPLPDHESKMHLVLDAPAPVSVVLR